MLQRCSRPLCSSQVTGGTAKRSHACRFDESVGSVVRGDGGPRGSSDSIPQDPTVCLVLRPFRRAFHSSELVVLTRCLVTRGQIVDVPLNEPRRLESFARETTNGQPSVDDCRELLRKEVIQPHLPVRLPCYDFVPIASPTFDGSLHKGWATGFGCCRLS